MNASTLEKPSGVGATDRSKELQFHKILVPIDFSRQGEPTIEYARQLAANSGATVYLLHVVETLGYADQFEEVLMETNKTELRCTERLRGLQGTDPSPESWTGVNVSLAG